MSFHQKPTIYVNHVQLKVQDLERSISFYQNVIGFNVLKQTRNTAQLTADGETVLVTLEQPENVTPKEGRTTGLYHFALLLPERSDLAKIVQHFQRHGVQFGSSDHLVSEALYLSDPDQNGIEIYVDRDPSLWTWKHNEVEMEVDPINFTDLLATSTNESWSGLPATTIMGHIHLHVADLQTAEAFYTKGLGLETVSRLGSQALFLSDGKYHHHIGMNVWNGVGAPPPAPRSVGLGSFTLLFPTKEKVEQVVDQLKGLGVEVMEADGGYVTADPSGNGVLLKS